MLLKSIVRVKVFTISIILIIILVSYSIGTVVLSGNAFPSRLMAEMLRADTPNLELYTATPVLPGGQTLLPRTLGGPREVHGLADATRLAEILGEKSLGPFVSWANGNTGPGGIYSCTSELTIIGGAYTGSPLIVVAPIKFINDNNTLHKIYYSDILTLYQKLFYDMIDKIVTNPNLYNNITKHSVYYYTDYNPFIGKSVHAVGYAYISSKPISAFPVGFLYSDYVGGQVLYPALDMEPPAIEIALLNYANRTGGLAYYYRSVDIIVAGEGALDCLGINPGLSAREGDGVVRGVVSPLLGWLLGIPSGSWGTVELGGVRLELWNPGISSGLYYSLLKGRVSSYTGFEYGAAPSLYHYLFAIFILPEDVGDIDRALSPASIPGSALLPVALDYVEYGFQYDRQYTPNITLRSLDSLHRFLQADRPVLAPSLIYLENVGRVNASSMVESVVEPARASSSEPAGLLGLTLPARAVIAQYNPDTFAGASRRDLSEIFVEERSAVSRAFGALDRIKGSASACYGLGNASKLIDLEYSTADLPTATIYTGNVEITVIQPPAYKVSRCLGVAVLDKYSGLDVVNMKTSAGYNNAMIMLGILSLIPSIFVAGWVIAGDTIELIIGSARRWLATASARGASLRLMRRSLILFILGVSALFSVAGAIASAWFSMGYSGAPWSMAGFVGKYKAEIAISVVVSILAISLVSLGKTKSVLSISPEEAVRPVESMVRASVPQRGRLNTLALAILVLVLGVGLLRVNLDKLDVDSYGAAGYVIAILVVIAYMLSPLGPLLALSEASRISTLALARRRIGRIISRAFVRLAGSLAWLAESSGEIIRDRVIGAARAGSLAAGLVIGSAVSAAGLKRLHDAIIVKGSSGISMTTLAGMRTVADTLDILALLGALFAGVMIIVVVLSVFRELERHVVILRARGASARQALFFVYASFAPLIVTTLLAGLATGLVFYAAVDSVTGIALMGDTGETAPHVHVGLDRMGAIAIGLLIAVLWLAPLIVSYGAARARDLARMLREGV